MDVEKAVTIRAIAKMFGYSEEFVRSGCHRAKPYHPIPCSWSGHVRPVAKIRPSKFDEWLNEEEGMNGDDRGRS